MEWRAGRWRRWCRFEEGSEHQVAKLLSSRGGAHWPLVWSREGSRGPPYSPTNCPATSVARANNPSPQSPFGDTKQKGSTGPYAEAVSIVAVLQATSPAKLLVRIQVGSAGSGCGGGEQTSNLHTPESHQKRPRDHVDERPQVHSGGSVSPGSPNCALAFPLALLLVPASASDCNASKTGSAGGRVNSKPQPPIPSSSMPAHHQRPNLRTAMAAPALQRQHGGKSGGSSSTRPDSVGSIHRGIELTWKSDPIRARFKSLRATPSSAARREL
jgi:hypothetical protein